MGKIIMKKMNGNYIYLDLKHPGKIIFSVSLGAQQCAECIAKGVKRLKHSFCNFSSIPVTNEKTVNFSAESSISWNLVNEVQEAFSGHFQIPQTKKSGKSGRLLWRKIYLFQLWYFPYRAARRWKKYKKCFLKQILVRVFGSNYFPIV